MSIHLRKPYRIIASKEKKYDAHYKIPSAKCLVVPVRILDQEVLCDIRWENENGELQIIHNAMFKNENLIPLNAMLDSKLHDVWSYYYNSDTVDQNSNNTMML